MHVAVHKGMGICTITATVSTSTNAFRERALPCRMATIDVYACPHIEGLRFASCINCSCIPCEDNSVVSFCFTLVAVRFRKQ